MPSWHSRSVTAASLLRTVLYLNRRAVAGVDGGDQLVPIGIDADLQNPDATVPTQDRVVVSMRPDRFGFFEVGERCFEQRRDGVRRASGFELRFGLALVQDSGVVELLVLVLQTLKD